MMISELPDFKQSKVLIYGDVMLDRYWYGDVSRISPEAPVPVVKVGRYVARAGGAANVALNLALLGAQVSCLGLVGDDAEAAELNQLLIDANVGSHLQTVADAQTITKLRVLGKNQQLIRLDFEREGLEPDQTTLQKYHDALQQGCNVVVLSDYAKGAMHNVADLIAMAKLSGCQVLVDPKHDDFAKYRGATLLTPNMKEFEAVVGPCSNDVELMVQKAQELILQYDFEGLLITRGDAGMLLVERNGATTTLPAHAQEVYDVTGAGDTVIAILAAALASGCDMVDSVYLANVAASLVVRKLGAASVAPAELRRELQQLTDSHLDVLTEGEALRAVLDAKAHGETVVMTNGCFDILHAGHIQYLQQAKQLGHRLLVAVNSDESVRQLKGDSRPINGLSERMELLAALRPVDWVVPFSEETPQRLIARILPDVLVKGGDYEVEQIAGHQEVLANGGQVKILSFRPGCSTTKVVKKIREELV